MGNLSSCLQSWRMNFTNTQASDYDLLKRRKVQSPQHRLWEWLNSPPKGGTAVLIAWISTFLVVSCPYKCMIFNHLKIKMLNLTSLWFLLILWLSYQSFSCPLAISQCTRCIGLRLMIKSFFFPLEYGTEVNYCSSLDLSADILPDQGHIPEIWDKGYFRLMEWDVYWKQDCGLRALHWLPSNFCFNEFILCLIFLETA